MRRLSALGTRFLLAAMIEYAVWTSGISKAPGIVTRVATHQKVEVSIREFFKPISTLSLHALRVSEARVQIWVRNFPEIQRFKKHKWKEALLGS